MRVFSPTTDDEIPCTVEGQLATLNKATKEATEKVVEFTIDGIPVKIKQAVVAKYESGENVLDKNGQSTFRYNTIYDAMLMLRNDKVPAKPPRASPEIPVVCHQQHLEPVAVCRMCMVHVSLKGRSSFVPACHRYVEDGMEVQTRSTNEEVRQIVQGVASLLMVDQPKPTNDKLSPVLHKVAEEVGLHPDLRLPKVDRKEDRTREPERERDETSFIIDVDHTACILCDACIRSCTDLKWNNVIGRTGRGRNAGIGFDLDDPMGESSCVSCGECAISCPTDALTLHVFPEHEWPEGYEPVSMDEILKDDLFKGVNKKFLEWNLGSMAKIRLNKDSEPLCRAGEYGSTAYRILKGRLEVSIETNVNKTEKKKSSGWQSLLRSYYIEQTPSDKVHQISGDMAAGVPVKKGVAEPIYRTPDDLIIGEMTCMSHYPRSATIRADEDTVVMEIMKNVLYVLQRNRASRKLLDDLYRERTFPVVMNELDLFAGVRKDAVRFKKLEDWLSSRLDLVRVNPGHRIFKQGDVADDLFIIRIGYVKFWQGKIGGEQIVRDYFGPNSYFGEIALLTGAGLLDLDPDKAKKHQLQAGLRTLNADAVDHVELVRISKDDFLQMCQDYPEIVEHAKATAQERLAQRDRIFWDSENTALAGYLRQGLANAQNLLVLDLESCTRCDECTKACSDSHQGITRLIRDGLRYDKYLVVSSCRSCQDPVCMIGCPTNAIHRGDSLEIRINDACIGCGQCASSCPYGNINMHPAPKYVKDEETEKWFVARDKHPKTGKMVPVIQYRATTCDTCAPPLVPEGQDPNCVFACPHDAAHRLSGEDFLRRVKGLPPLPPSAGNAAH